MADQIYVEVSSLHDLHFSGIPCTTARLVEAALDRGESKFFVGGTIVPNDVVEAALRAWSGAPLIRAGLERHNWPSLIRDLASRSGRTVGLFPNLPPPITFDRAVQIVHDLVPLIQPQFCAPGVQADYFSAYFADYGSDDRVICVSEATAQTVREHLSVPDEAIRVIQHEPSGPPSAPRQIPVGPYVLVLGTVEPRKNIELVLKLLARRASLLAAYEFVFVGRDGWHMSFEGAMSSAGLAPNSPRVTRLNFVDEAFKWELISSASAVLLPSHFEGFGLSAAEASSIGVQVLASDAASIPEAAGPTALLFNPENDEELSWALDQLASRTSAVRPTLRVRERSFADAVLDVCWEV